MSDVTCSTRGRGNRLGQHHIGHSHQTVLREYAKTSGCAIIHNDALPQLVPPDAEEVFLAPITIAAIDACLRRMPSGRKQ